jgi:putative nucleotidyltransferase with HDIG domain
MDIAKDVRTVRFLPAYFSVISRLLGLLSMDEPSIPDIVEAVSADQALVSRLLNMVNSPVHGTVRPIGSIEDAVVRIGLLGLRNMALAISMNDITGGVKVDEWKHSITVGFIADLLAHKTHTPANTARLAFVSGLMHDIGKLFLTRRYMLEYQTVYNKMSRGSSQVDAEKSTFGMDHAAVGGMLLSAWKIPPTIVDSIKLHHQPGDNLMALVICSANQLLVWGGQPANTRAELDLMGLSQSENERIYADAARKAHEMQMSINKQAALRS